MLIEKRPIYTDSCTTVIDFRKTPKVGENFAIEGSDVTFSSKKLGHICEINIDFEIATDVERKITSQAKFSDKFVHIHSLTIYTDLIEHNFVRDTKAQLLFCFLFDWKLKAVDLLATREENT